MKKSQYRSNSIGTWLFLAVVLAIIFLGYIGFSLHEERNYVKFKLKHSAHSNKLPIFTASHIDQQKNLLEDDKKKNDIINLTMIHSSVDLDDYNQGYKMHAFNELVSDRIGYQARNIPDTRPDECLDIIYEVQAQVSVIICFYNEATSTLLRTISTVFERTSPKLLKEVIVVDDGSINEIAPTVELFVESKYLKMKLHILRSDTQLGLIRARMFGARHATGDTLVFLDSHCEVNEGWIEPLLQLLVNQTSRVVSPVVDTIHPDTFQYQASVVVRGGFNWGLHFAWEALPNSVKNPSKAFPTPTISGGLFAVNREGFFALGGYDEGMEEWGGENLELSFRTWMCGGSLYIEPCSRVGHVFRRRRPYGKSDFASLRNSIRVAEVWLDEFKVHFYNTRKEAKSLKFGDLTERSELRSSLKCKAFKWFLDNIYPEISIPNERNSAIKYKTDRPVKNTIAKGSISVSGLSICLNAELGAKPFIQAGPCEDGSGKTIWSLNDKGEILLDGTKLCLEGSATAIRLSKCDGSEGFQSWTFLDTESSEKTQLTGKLYNIAIGQCLSVNQVAERSEVVMSICSKRSVQSFTVSYLPQS